MDYRALCLVMTDRCNAECAFCGLRCKRDNRNVISESLARSAMEQAKEMSGFKRLALSGGEAFLYPDLAARLLDYARELGFAERTIATNGFWGGWPDEKIARTLDALSSCTAFSFSYDAFHAEWIPERNIWRAVQALGRRGKHYTISVADVPGEKGAAPFLSSLGEDALNRKYHAYPLQPAGRAGGLPDSYFFREVDWEKCACFTAEAIAVWHDGTIYPCCAPSIVDTAFSLGNLNETSLSYALFRSPGAKLLAVLNQRKYFVRLISMARDEWGVPIPDKVVNGCEACYAMFTRPGILERAISYAETVRTELLLEHLFEDGNAQEA